jgi:hypothetical protein
VAEPLVCPGCASRFDGEERFCTRCGLPLVHAESGEELHVSRREELARKVKPQYAEGDLVRLVGVGNQVEGEFVQGLLLEEGIPSLMRRRMGFDVPEFMASGPRDVLVPRSGLLAARDVLLQAELLPSPVPGPSPTRLLLTMLAVLAVVALLVVIVDAVV